MSRSALFVLLIVISSIGMSQEGITQQALEPVGGRSEFNQVLETQLTLPEILLTKNFAADITVHFSIDTAGRATELVFEGVENNVLRHELTRIFRFFRFETNALPEPTDQPWYIGFNLSTPRYNKYLKQRSKSKIKPVAATDSSFIVYTKADRSPTYYKNDDAGLAEYILEEISYPNVARERSVQGTVVLEFIVEANGFVTGIEPKKKVTAGCTEEAVRLISETRWQPAVVGGKAVRYRMTYPITFSLRSADGRMQPASTVGN